MTAPGVHAESGSPPCALHPSCLVASGEGRPELTGCRARTAMNSAAFAGGAAAGSLAAGGGGAGAGDDADGADEAADAVGAGAAGDAAGGASPPQAVMKTSATMNQAVPAFMRRTLHRVLAIESDLRPRS
jgi:hypothetical protein